MRMVLIIFSIGHTYASCSDQEYVTDVESLNFPPQQTDQKTQIVMTVANFLKKRYHFELYIREILEAERLDLSGRLISFDPKEQQDILENVCCFYWITEFTCSENNLQSLPKNIDQLTNLKTFYCGRNNLTTLPNAHHLKELQILDISHNNFAVFPPEISELTNLKTLDCSHNHLSLLPNEIGSLINLQNFWCQHNQILTLPFGMGSMKSLITLDAAHNKIQLVSSLVGNLTNLITFMLEDNDLAESGYGNIAWGKKELILAFGFLLTL